MRPEQAAGHCINGGKERVLRRRETGRRQARHVRNKASAREATGDVVEADGGEQRNETVALHGEPDEQEIAQRPRERANHHRAHQTVTRHRHATGEDPKHRHADTEDLPDLDDLNQAVAEVEIERVHDVHTSQVDTQMS